MKKLFGKNSLFLLFSLLAFGAVRAQGLERGTEVTANASQVYFELGGPGIIYSFNYDGRFGQYENGIGFRIGVGGASVNGSGYVAVPVQINYLAGVRGKYLEIGAGATYDSGLDLFGERDSQPGSPNHYTYGTFTIGFRRQPLGRKGFTFRAAFSPIISFHNGGSFLPFAGVSWGIKF
ncbi:MAG TPA: hypothetical protein VK543_17660 [Puia sp.]|nr:hypothetical protein [Puia sp.]